MTEEQNKLAEEIGNCGFYADPDGTTFRIIPAKLSEQIIAALREPATEAVLERCFRALNEFDDDVDMEDYDSVAQWWQRHGGPALNAMRAALKGKGASQGAGWIPVARTEAATKYINAAPGRPVWFVDGNGQIWHYNLPPLPAPNEQKG